MFEVPVLIERSARRRQEHRIAAVRVLRRVLDRRHDQPLVDDRERFRNPLQPKMAAAAFKSCGLLNLGVDEQLWGKSGQFGDKQALVTSIYHSLRYLQSDAAAAAYRRYPVAGVTRERVYRSLWRFRQHRCTP